MDARFEMGEWRQQPKFDIPLGPLPRKMPLPPDDDAA
jgi:hypothetical protein